VAGAHQDRVIVDLSGVDFYDRPSMRGLSVKGGRA